MRHPSAILNLPINEFLSCFIAWGKICVCILNFMKFGQFAAEIWRYNDCQNGGSPPCWIFEIEHFHHLTIVWVQLCLRTPKFRLNRTTWSRVIAKKMIFIWCPSAILNLGISEFLSRFCCLGQNLHLHTRFRQIRTIRGLRYGI